MDNNNKLKQQHDLADTASSSDAKKPRLREPKVKWTAEEDAQLAAGVEKYGTDTKAWNQIADTFNGTRDVKRCRERWQEYIDPSLSHVAFTDAEDTAILACQRHFGNQWKMIAEVMSKQHEHRSATAIKSRWHQLQKREKRMNKYAERRKTARASKRSIRTGEVASHHSSSIESTTMDSISHTHSFLPSAVASPVALPSIPVHTTAHIPQFPFYFHAIPEYSTVPWSVMPSPTFGELVGCSAMYHYCPNVYNNELLFKEPSRPYASYRDVYGQTSVYYQQADI